MRTQGVRIAVVLAALALVVGIMAFPRQPASVKDTIVRTPLSAAERELEAAVQMVQSGQSPMEGILKIRALVEADSTFEEAHLWLGAFSLQSGQRDKAVERFETVIRLNPANPEPHWQLAMMAIDEQEYRSAIPYLMQSVALDSAYVNGLFFAARCNEEIGEKEEALRLYRQYLPYATDTVVNQRVNEFIALLETEIN
jgi:tetratricopeptide (TPR) repeat protein